MDLTPEDKKIGKDNFNQVIGTTRRDFLVGTVATAGATGFGLGSMYFNYGAKLDDPLRIGVIGTGDEGSVLIGALNPDFVDVVAIADIRPYNLHRAFYGDLSSPNAKKARPGLLKVYEDRYGWKDRTEAEKHIKVYADKYQEMYEDDSVEAVIIALPLWLHHVASIEAMKAGKHVLTEKLMAQTVGQCKEMGRVAKETNKVLATGHQRHYSILYANAVDTIKRGFIGDIHHIRAQWHRGNMPGKDSWRPPMPTEYMEENTYLDLRRKVKKEQGDAAEGALRTEHKILEQYFSLVKKSKDTKNYSYAEREIWEQHAQQAREQLKDLPVKAEDYGYMDNTLENGSGYKVTALEELIRWRLWNRTGAGLMAELGSHQLDAASIFISAQNEGGGKVYPLNVTAAGQRSIFPPNREVDDHVYATYEFPAPGYYKHDQKDGEVADPNKKIVVTYSSINGNGYGGYGEVVMGTKGTLILEKEKDVMLYKGSSTATNVKVGKGRDGPQLDTTESGGQEAAVAAAATPVDVSRGYREEIEHWAWVIRNPGKGEVKCGPKVAMADAIIALTTNIAIKEQRRIEFKPEWFDIDSPETPESIAPRDTSELG
ncbi:Gfo/Idh/MocA family protein [Adhaeretor mobilis]|uniref:Glucose--fructose oxidoreductase n=1 Tax=Adhaeretor mobilis TaxID=1930276 RepID=A0A517MPV0_9BACT|nr:Gfo/Idh/MocA family oxidoreductase [Adhaeretor mobilis]QDS96899.1 Glucose--fructose oxidoreductase precursor [Adhaeretor mobilis]